jgi:hypothetical protein
MLCVSQFIEGVLHVVPNCHWAGLSGVVFVLYEGGGALVAIAGASSGTFCAVG